MSWHESILCGTSPKDAVLLLAQLCLIFCLAGGFLATSDSDPSRQPGAGDVAATMTWIEETATPEQITDKIRAIQRGELNSIPLDDSILRIEFERRFVDGRAWATNFTSPQNQALCWLAECNKRIFGSNLKQRAEQREVLLARVVLDLGKATTATEICELLDISSRTVYYGEFVKPKDGTKPIIDLFKQYVGHENQTVHDFACKRLRFMGKVSFEYYNEVLQFLIEHAPELRKQLTAPRVPGIYVDILLGGDAGPFETDELKYLRIDVAAPSELATIAKSTLKGGDRVQSVCGFKAMRKLVVESCKPGGDASLAALSGLVRDGIKFQDVLWRLSSRAVEAIEPADAQASQKALGEALTAFREMPQENWPRDDSRGRAQVLDGIIESLKLVYPKAPKTSMAGVVNHLQAARRQITQE